MLSPSETISARQFVADTATRETRDLAKNARSFAFLLFVETFLSEQIHPKLFVFRLSIRVEDFALGKDESAIEPKY